MKRFVLLLLCLLVLGGTVVPVLASEEGKLLIWADDTRAGIMRELAGEFTAKYKVPVEVQELNFGDIRDQLSVAGPAGKGPDILIGPHDWLGQLIVNGLIEPIDLGVKEKDFTPVAIAAFSWGDELYGVPYAIESIGLIYNKKLVPQAPQTWEELRTIGAKVANRSAQRWGFCVPHPDPYHEFPIMSAGGAYVFGNNPDGTLNPDDIGLNKKGGVEGMRLLKALIDDGIMPLGVDSNATTTLFKEGKVGMVIAGPWVLEDVRKAGVDYGIAKIPLIDGKRPRPFVGVQGFMISAFSRNKMLAKAFLDEYVITEETMLALFEKGARPPVYIPALNAVKDPDAKAFYEIASEGVPMPSIPEMNSVWSAWSNAIELIFNGKLTPEQALDEAVAQIRTAIEQGRK
ncbi:MAG: maltose ABC transporter substrate-binding protein [Firmicutes bacterium]|nr:maltose ABC transporter substrate-binding protein [Bacillota bacterium]